MEREQLGGYDGVRWGTMGVRWERVWGGSSWDAGGTLMDSKGGWWDVRKTKQTERTNSKQRFATPAAHSSELCPHHRSARGTQRHPNGPKSLRPPASRFLLGLAAKHQSPSCFAAIGLSENLSRCRWLVSLSHLTMPPAPKSMVRG